MTSPACNESGRSGPSAADSWQQDLRQQLRADIQQEFNKLSVSLVQEIRLLSSEISKPLRASLDGGSGMTSMSAAYPAQDHLPVVGPNVPTSYQHRALFGQGLRVSSLSSNETGGPMMVSTNSQASKIRRDAMIAEERSGTWLDNIVLGFDKVNEFIPEEPNRLKRFVMSKYFTWSSLVVIMANAIWMSYEVDFELSVLLDPEHDSADTNTWRNKVSLAFLGFFAVELILRAIVLRKSFIFGEDWKWNLYDVLLVAASIPELFEENTNVSFLRVLRVLRTAKSLRLLRLVKVVGSLREIVFSFLQTLSFLFWSFMAILLSTYMFALMFMQQLNLMLTNGHTPSSQVVEGLMSTGQSMVTLFSMISGGDDWHPFMEGFHGSDYLSLLSKGTFLFYVFFMLFGLVNVIIGTFCARASESILSDGDHLALKHEHRYKSVIHLSLKVFHAIGVKANGSITREEFHQYVKSPDSLALHGIPGFSDMKLFDVGGIWQVMLSLSKADDNTVDLPAFVLTLVRLSGESTPEIVMMAMNIQNIDMRLCRIFDTLEQHSQAGHQQSSTHGGIDEKGRPQRLLIQSIRPHPAQIR